MKCNFPVYLNNQNMFVPCGKCEACLEARQMDWSYRLMCESGYHKDTVFLTLTYDDDKIGCTLKNEVYNLVPRHLQLFFKRLRKDYDKTVKYYAVGEYGDDFKRPHYHIILFGIGIEYFVSKSAGVTKTDRGLNLYDMSLWSYGMCNVGTVTNGSIKYVTSYLITSVDRKEYEKKGIQPPFSRQSQGLGKQYCLDNEDTFRKGYVSIKGSKLAIPRYFKKKNENISNYLTTPVVKPFSYMYYYKKYNDLLTGLVPFHPDSFEYYKKMLEIKYAEQYQANQTQKMKKNLKKC